MRRLLPLLVVLCALTLVASVAAAPLFVVTGRGWGHAVGMSQWGAYGMAKNGKTYREILTHYYSGTTIGKAPERTIGVLLASSRSSVSIGSAAAYTVTGKGGTPVRFGAGTRTVTRTSTGKIRVGDRRFASPATFAPTEASAPLALNSSRYRGKLVVSAVSGGVRVVNRVGVEGYLKGVVPRESPDYWGSVGAQAALEAQAVAARSYALASGGHCGGGLFCPDTYDQVYGGYDGESPNASAAVNATAHEVVKYGTAIAKTYFHSSSGGRTASSVDVWGGDLPYLKSVRDYDLHADNPHRRWRFTLTSAGLASRVGTSRRPTDARLTRDASGLAQVLTVSGSGWSASVEGSETLRSRMATKSARFWIGAVDVRPGATRVTYGSPVSLRGLSRSGDTIGWGTARLQRTDASGAWVVAADGLPEGRWTRSHTPKRATDYRVVSGNVIGFPSRVDVVTRVRFYEATSTRTLRGVIAPARAVPVVLDRRRRDGTWAREATTTAAADGTFSFALTRGGTYRASADAGAGLLLGRTAPRTIG